MLETIREKAITNEFDYTFLMDCLSDYDNPRDKITRLLKSGAIVRIKKGLYVFGPRYSKGPFSKETLANLIYGPSYISLEYALSFYGMIPERIEVITSITNKKNKLFNTPAGVFSYKHLNPDKYSFGITSYQLDEHHNILIASKEKALVDKICGIKEISTKKDLKTYLIDDLRIEIDQLKTLRTGELAMLARVFKNKTIDALCEYVKELK